LVKNGERKPFPVHRLVAEAFIPNPENLPCVCHRDDNPLNNHVDNLFWGTQADNIRDMDIKKRRYKKRIIALLPNFSIKYNFESICQAARHTGLNKGNIANCLTNKRKTAGGLIWQYA